MDDFQLSDKQLKKILDIKSDLYRYIENNLWIRTKSGKLERLVPNKPQKALIDYVLYCLELGIPVRVILLKARQMGLSTIVEAICYWWTSTNKHQTAVIIGHEDTSAKNLYMMFRRYYDNSNPIFKPSVKYNTRSDLTFERYDDGGNQVGLGSVIKTATAKNTSAGRSDTVQFLHACMHPDSKIILADGSSVTAKDIKVGDLVFTCSGNIAPVKNKFYPGVKDTFALKVWGSNEPIYISSEHKVLTIDGYKKLSELTTIDYIQKPKYSFEEKYELEYTYNTPHRVQNGGKNVSETRTIELDYDFGYMVGYYLAEGHVKSSNGFNNQITFTYHKDEKYVDKVKQFFNNTTDRIVGNRGITDCYDTFMAHLINDTYGRVDNKHIPLFGNDDYYKGILDGYLDGDGSKTQLNRVSATSVHEKIARNINRIGDILGRHAGLKYKKDVYRYDVKVKSTYINEFNQGASKPHIRKYKIVDGITYVRVRSINEYETSEVIDIEIDHPDHNFETPIGIISNSEVGEWENGEELIASLMQTIPDLPNTFIFLESTAKGKGNYFHKEWRNAEKGENNFVPFFFPWWLIDEYEVYDDEDIGTLSEYEEFLISLFKKGFNTFSGDHYAVTEEQYIPKIKFYRRKSKDFASDPTRMYQEYPSVAKEAFVASGANVFPVLELEKMEHQTLEVDEYDYYNLKTGDNHEDYILDRIEYDPRVEDFTAVAPLKVFDLPEPGKEYVIGADVAEGLKNGDFSVAEVVETTSMKTVARWRGHCDPDRFGEILGALGALYNHALIGVEVNNHGLTTVQKLRDTYYTNLYKREKGYDEDFEEPTSNLGWKTDVRTKRLAIDDLIRIIREGLNEEKDMVFVEEAFAFVRDIRGRMNAEEGEHDDTVMAKAITFQLFNWGDNDISKLAVIKKLKKHKVINNV